MFCEHAWNMVLFVCKGDGEHRKRGPDEPCYRPNFVLVDERTSAILLKAQKSFRYTRRDDGELGAFVHGFRCGHKTALDTKDAQLLANLHDMLRYQFGVLPEHNIMFRLRELIRKVPLDASDV